MASKTVTRFLNGNAGTWARWAIGLVTVGVCGAFMYLLGQTNGVTVKAAENATAIQAVDVKVDHLREDVGEMRTEQRAMAVEQRATKDVVLRIEGALQAARQPR